MIQVLYISQRWFPFVLGRQEKVDQQGFVQEGREKRENSCV